MRVLGGGLLFILVFVASASAQQPEQLALEQGSSTARVVGSMGGAIGGGLLAGGACLLYVNETQEKVDPNDDDEAYISLDISAAAWLGICYALVSPLAIAGGATLAGDGLGGQGRYGAALAGAGIGFLSGLLATAVAAAATEDDDVTEATALVSLGAMPVLGASLAYALDSAGQSRHAATRLMPIAGITDGGRGVSLGARITF